MDDKLVEDVKVYLGITTDDIDITRNIELKVNVTKLYLIKAGMKKPTDGKYDDEVIGCIATGVNDLLNNKAGETKFSPAFTMLAMQICRG